MNYYLKVVAPKLIKKEELEKLVVQINNDRVMNGKPLLTQEEIKNFENNINNNADRMGTLDVIETLVFNYSPKMKELKNQLDFQDIRKKFKAFNYNGLNYLELSESEYVLLKKLMEHDNYCNRLQNGSEVPLKDVGEILSSVFNCPNVKPLDYEKPAE